MEQLVVLTYSLTRHSHASPLTPPLFHFFSEYKSISPSKLACNFFSFALRKTLCTLPAEPTFCSGRMDDAGKKGSGGASGMMRCCQVEKCNADLHEAKQYHRRHKVCEYHAKAQVVLVGGTRQRFCQQCSRFHELAEFDDTKRSCRRRLAGHNERRRKNPESQAEASSRKGTGTQLKDTVCGQVDDRGRIQITIQENAAYKNFQIR